jgi:hypothetical protein
VRLVQLELRVQRVSVQLDLPDLPVQQDFKVQLVRRAQLVKLVQLAQLLDQGEQQDQLVQLVLQDQQELQGWPALLDQQVLKVLLVLVSRYMDHMQIMQRLLQHTLPENLVKGTL